MLDSWVKLFFKILTSYSLLEKRIIKPVPRTLLTTRVTVIGQKSPPAGSRVQFIPNHLSAGLLSYTCLIKSFLLKSIMTK